MHHPHYLVPVLALAIGSASLAAARDSRDAGARGPVKKELSGSSRQPAGSQASTGRAGPKFRQHPNGPRSGRYIVVLEEGTHADLVGDVALELAAARGGRLRHLYRRALKGFSVEMPGPAAAALSADPRVAFVEEDTLAFGLAVQSNAPWGLDRIDQRARPGDGLYRYGGDGRGVHLYILDSGVRVSHAEFAPAGRATLDYGPSGMDDCHGHGTAVASVAAGVTTGVAKAAYVHSVRVLDCNATGTWSDVIDGIEWVTAYHRKPAVINMSIGSSGVVSSVRLAMQGALDAGVVFVAAAGNGGTDACGTTPAFVRDASGGAPALPALLAGNVDSSDRRQAASNYGACVDIFAPGTDIASASRRGDSAYSSFTGTSMAAPLVSGAAALYLQRTPAARPAEVLEAVVDTATRDVLSDLNTGSPNRLLFARPLGDRTAPSVSLVAPAAGSTVSGTIDITANASDDVEIALVEFYAGTTLIGSDPSAPYSARWTTTSFANGSHAVKAVAIDAGGNAAASVRTVTVSNGTVRRAVDLIEAEQFDAMSGIVRRDTYIGYLDAGDWVKYAGVDFGAGVSSIALRLAVHPAYAGKQIQIRLDAPTGQLAGTLTVSGTGGWHSYATQTSSITSARGVHDLYLVFAGGAGVANIDWLRFSSGPASGARNAFSPIEAESYDAMSGIVRSGSYIGYLDEGDWVKYGTVDFEGGASAVSIRVAVDPAYAGRQIQLRLDSPSGPLAGALRVASTGGWYTFATQTTSIAGASGTRDLYLVFSGGNGVGNIDWLQFAGSSSQASGELSPAGWTASASASYSPASRAIDRQEDSKWQNGRSQASSNDHLQVDLGSPASFTRIALDHAPNVNDYPVAYEVSISSDGRTWTRIASGSGTPGSTSIVLASRVTARHVRVTETGSSGAYWFTVNELRLFDQ